MLKWDVGWALLPVYFGLLIVGQECPTYILDHRAGVPNYIFDRRAGVPNLRRITDHYVLNVDGTQDGSAGDCQR